MNRYRSVLTNGALLTALVSLVVSGCGVETEGNGGASGGSFGGETLGDWQGVTLLEELWRVGQMDGPEYDVLGSVSGVTFVGTDLVVADEHSNRIHWFDGTGEHVVSTGRSGDGPGEFFAVGSLGALPDGTLAALNRGGSVELFARDGALVRSVRFPARPREMCLMDSSVVVLGTLLDSDRSLHIMDLAGDDGWTSIGPATTDGPQKRSLVSALLDGHIACAADRVVYARSSDGTVRALSLDGAALWEVEIPSFVSMVHEDAGERGVRHGPPEGATEIHEFRGVAHFGQTVAVQILRADLRGADRLSAAERSVLTVYLDLATGRILGRDDSLPPIVAASDDRIALAIEAPVPEILVYSITH